jgi:SAM-dependent methyltransferase
MDKYFFDAPQAVHPERLWSLAQGCRGVVYDIGCGRHKTDPAFIGVDVLPVADVQASAEALPFGDASADYVISKHSLEHVLDPVAALTEWRRVLKSKGKILVVLPDHGALDTMDPFYSAGQHLHAYTMGSFGNFVRLFYWLRVLKLEPVVPHWSFGAVLVVEN